MFRHIVLFRTYEDVSDDRVAEALLALRSLGNVPGVVDWRVELSSDLRKGRVIVEDATFIDREAFDRFRLDPRHAAVAAEMALIADWWNGDYES